MRTSNRGRRRAAVKKNPPRQEVGVPSVSEAPGTPPETATGARRAVFFDVENSSRVEHISSLLEHLKLRVIGRETELLAVGNWGVIGHETARLLAHHGAELVHTAPAFGVKDWSDLRIAVTAGIWLGMARPGDILEIITDDQAFDAVGDVAAGLGVSFRRLSYRTLVGAKQIGPTASSRRTRSRTRKPADSRAGERGPDQPAAAAHGAVAQPGVQAAPRDDLLDVVHELVAASGDRTVTLDAVSNALKARGFRRPSGSPRLITRLRQLKNVEVSATGTIRLLVE